MKNTEKILLMLTAFFIMACGEKKEEDEKITLSDKSTIGKATVVEAQAKAPVEKEVVEVSISAGDQMQFSKNEIKVKAGTIVKLTLTHTGEMSENVMGHNFVLLEEGTDISEFGLKAMKAPENNYIPEDGEEVIAHTEVIGGGESVTIEFRAPEAGVYDFICSFPGHFAVMQGKFIVE